MEHVTLGGQRACALLADLLIRPGRVDVRAETAALLARRPVPRRRQAAVNRVSTMVAAYLRRGRPAAATVVDMAAVDDQLVVTYELGSGGTQVDVVHVAAQQPATVAAPVGTVVRRYCLDEPSRTALVSVEVAA